MVLVNYFFCLFSVIFGFFFYSNFPWIVWPWISFLAILLYNAAPLPRSNPTLRLCTPSLCTPSLSGFLFLLQPQQLPKTGLVTVSGRFKIKSVMNGRFGETKWSLAKTTTSYLIHSLEQDQFWWLRLRSNLSTRESASRKTVIMNRSEIGYSWSYSKWWLSLGPLHLGLIKPLGGKQIADDF